MAVSEKAEVITQEEGRQILDREAQRSLRISGKDFLAAWDAGAYEGKADTPDIMRLVELIPLAR
ncbi:MAG: hypothetical protein HY534_06945 [Chloroflexi bacterium]|nr:hypothetical protein [Chloroflexota bacterium]